jgi:hypothetical protein
VKWNPEDELWTIVLDTMDTHGENCTHRIRWVGLSRQTHG